MAGSKRPPAALPDLLAVAWEQEESVRRARAHLEQAIDIRNETVRSLRHAGASYAQIAGALGLSRAGAVGICRKLELA
jgi:hypothetical protein